MLQADGAVKWRVRAWGLLLAGNHRMQGPSAGTAIFALREAKNHGPAGSCAWRWGGSLGDGVPRGPRVLRRRLLYGSRRGSLPRSAAMTLRAPFISTRS
jgi:hypothetical protein